VENTGKPINGDKEETTDDAGEMTIGAGMTNGIGEAS
jgi:hypothetical protein